MSAVADVLNGAADLIERDGWVQGGYRAFTGERCIANALMVSASWPSLIYTDALGVLSSSIGTSLPTLWNDTPGRTKAEVVAALRAAAEQAS